MKRLPFFLIVASMIVNSCKNDGCNDPLAFNYDPDGTSEEACIYEPKQIMMSVTPMFGAKEVALNDSLMQEDGRGIILTYYGMYLSDLSFKEESEDDYQRWNLNDVALIKEGQLDQEAVYLNKSAITGFRFDVGVDTAIYKEDPTNTTVLADDHPLAIQEPNMWWSWATGYRFISIEGKVDTSAAMDGSGYANFAFHTGLPANLKTITFDSTDFTFNGNTMDIGLKVDLAKLLEGIDFINEDLMIHNGAHPVTVRIMNNAESAFELE